jgi:hypothetical protein
MHSPRSDASLPVSCLYIYATISQSTQKRKTCSPRSARSHPNASRDRFRTGARSRNPRRPPPVKRNNGGGDDIPPALPPQQHAASITGAAPAAGPPVRRAVGEGLRRVPRRAVEEGDAPGRRAQRPVRPRRPVGRLGRRGGAARRQEAVLGRDQRRARRSAAAAGPRHVHRRGRGGRDRVRVPRVRRRVRGGASRCEASAGGERQAAGGRAARRLRPRAHGLGRLDA